jgi:hypothetical protein
MGTKDSKKFFPSSFLSLMEALLSGAPHFLVGILTGIGLSTAYYSYRNLCPGLLGRLGGATSDEKMTKSTTIYSPVPVISHGSSDSSDSVGSIEVEMSSLSTKLPSDDLDDVFRPGQSAFDTQGRFRVRDGQYDAYENPFANEKMTEQV